ncbi:MULTISPECIES: hypothetical protein [Methylomonas]|uniref:Uncharacterized protein n=1 Tax=Methylomonas koyamae TaxID=702114 RepID=A0AA91D8K9_9GAMM|nr:MULTISPECIES: hypothetical protein [Methylomonas]ANE57975.1 hypothetical protein AYM39_22080 [Methylomonas sp. DH-1]OAI21777.1 hypothetical protein A1356_20395 [Methylomonas koyamae]
MYKFKPLKRVIQGKAYNTETSTLIHEYITESDLEPINPLAAHYPFVQQLYRNRLGKLFFVFRNEKYQNLATGETNYRDTIAPVEINQAIRWLERHTNDFGKIDALKGTSGIENSSETLTLRMDDDLKRNIGYVASVENTSLNSWCVRNIKNALFRSTRLLKPSPYQFTAGKNKLPTLSENGQPIKRMDQSHLWPVQTEVAALIYEFCPKMHDHEITKLVYLFKTMKDELPIESILTEVFDDFINWLELYSRGTATAWVDDALTNPNGPTFLTKE